MNRRLRTGLDLDEIFGKDRAQEDVNLHKYFVKTNDYENIISGRRELVLGRKGAGKSSLFAQLRIDLNKLGKIPIPISPSGEDFVRINSTLEEFQNLNFDDDYKYSLAWKEYILSEIAFSAIQSVGRDSILYRYLVDNERLKGDYVTRFANAIIKAFSGGRMSIYNTEIDIDFTGFQGITSPEQNEIKNSLSKLIAENEFYVLLDNLDEPWKNNTQLNSWLRGLILSMRQLKREFNNLKVIAFLRDDIFDEICKGSDLFDSSNEILRIKWKDDNNYTLRKLVALRIATYYNLDFNDSLSSLDEYWNIIYPLKLNYGAGRNKYLTTYLIERTFNRPRELLQFCRGIIEKSQSNFLPVPEEAIFMAERDYSTNKIIDLVGEFSKTYSGIEECILSFAGVTQNWIFDYNKLKEHYDSLNDGFKIFNKVEEKCLSLDELITFLYKVGFFRKIIKKQYGVDVKISYRTSSEDPSIIPKITEVDIHQAFRKRFTEI